MFELRIAKEQYQRMPDEELIRFAKNEAEHLTMESFHLLQTEFESRGLDIGVLEEVKTDRLLAELDRKTTVEKVTNIEYTEMIWKFALDQKEAGKTNNEILNALMKKGVDEPYASMLLETLESKSKELVDNFDTEITVGWILIIVGLIALFLVVVDVFNSMVSLYGLMSIVGGIVRLFTSNAKKKKYQTIVDNIKEEKENFKDLYQ